ncbi:MAG: hypothetical protein FDZ75_02475 [Actinobacteria bacterium]|nr:MAG: hypothetical protein FDZ75_02475 [Actinomycetota bacterium]
MAAAEWCIRCCTYRTVLDPVTGWCVVCTAKARNDEQKLADEDEERRLMEEVGRESNAIKKARQRMREEYGANPRKGRR